jgi:hypothetical protein
MSLPLFSGRRAYGGFFADKPVPLGCFNHRGANSVLDLTERVEELALDDNLSVETRNDAVESHQRCALNRPDDVDENLAHTLFSGKEFAVENRRLSTTLDQACR